MNPSQFIPRRPEDFIGPARLTVETLMVSADRALRDKQPMKILLYGPPGTGKTRVAECLLRYVGIPDMEVNQTNGRDTTIHDVRHWPGEDDTSSLFSTTGWKGRIVDEVDTMPRDAQDFCLTYLDQLRPCRIVVATSNQMPSDIPARLFSRFQSFHVGTAKSEEVAGLLERMGVPPQVAQFTAATACGNIRLALLSAQTWFDREEAKDIRAQQNILRFA